MQTNSSFTRMGYWILPIFSLMFMSIIFISCNGKASKKPTCVKLTKAQLKKWVDKGYTDTSNSNNMVGVRFRVAFGGGTETVFRVFAVGIKEDGQEIPESLTELMPNDECPEIKELSAFIHTGQISFPLDALEILDENGKIVENFKHLLITPGEYIHTSTRLRFLTLDPDVFFDNQTLKSTDRDPPVGLPCPPCENCRFRCPPPDDCEGGPPCSPLFKDTTAQRSITDTISRLE